MARRRYFRTPAKFDRGPRINLLIREPKVRLIDENDAMRGIVNIEEARRLAEQAGLDLVEIAPDSEPPVCKIVDYGRYKYEQSKRDRANKAKSKGMELKEVRLGRSMKIDPHDIAIRLNQARKFLMEGHKVQIVQNFRGREMIHRHRGTERMKDIMDKMEDVAKVETPPRMFGKRMSMILAPDKTKIEQIKRRLAQEKENAEKAKEAPTEKPPVEVKTPVVEIPKDSEVQPEEV